jgi:uncharacterized protein YgbK (DUF1537 family)
MDALRVVADDLTGACDIGAELLCWSGGVVVRPAPDAPRHESRRGTVCVRNTQSRTLPPAAAADRVSAVLADVGPGWAGLVLKKIDTGLRGQLGAEIDAAMNVLGIEESFVLPAIPEIGRTTQQGRQMIGGIPVHLTAFARDPQNPIADASVTAAVEASGQRRAAVIDLAAVRGDLGRAVDEARARGADVLVCDAETDADLERAVRGLLSRRRPLLLVGSVGLARALRRVLGSEQGARPPVGGPPAAPGSGVLVVAGSAHPATRAQIERAAARRLVEPLVVAPDDKAEDAGLAAGRLLRAGRPVALVAPAESSPEGSPAVLASLRRAALTALSRARPSGLVLIGGETAYHVLEGLGLPELWLEARLSPLVVRARLVSGPYAGLALVTKGGSTGAPDIVGAIVRQLGRGTF